MDILLRIKQLIVREQYRFTRKARNELLADALDEAAVLESILNAERIKKIIRSSDQRGEKLYVIESGDDHGTLIYSKGKISPHEDKEIYYILISSKRSTRSS